MFKMIIGLFIGMLLVGFLYNVGILSLTLPLQEAGKNIQDKEIAQFYYELLDNAGWTIESN